MFEIQNVRIKDFIVKDQNNKVTNKMAIKKSELYATLWKSCDELRGGMDASQYKDYVLVMLFVKYISDKYAGKPFEAITVPDGSTFNDMVALKGKPTIGDDINKKILGPIGIANKMSDFPDFADVTKLGDGADQVKKLSNLIAIFENPALNFSKNNAEGDDILGDAYEYLMRHFATESGKSKGQFYTPSEVSRIMSKIIGINNQNSSAATTAYDPTSGSGSLLLKVMEEAEKGISLYGQEMDVATAALSRMNMILHNSKIHVIKQGNTLAKPLFTKENGELETFDFVVANPPFSFKSWSNGVKVDSESSDDFGRFKNFGVPPEKNGDYAFLLHIVRSLKSNGKGAVILPHGVLFRGNAEATIRQNLIRKGYIKGIIGLPPNLFYGTGIPACIILLDKENSNNRKAIFMIDAGKGFVKDGNKNRLQEKDIHKIVDVFNKQQEIPKFSRIVSFDDIEKNEYNLNIPRYIDNQEVADIQDIEAHLLGDIPKKDIEALQNFWDIFPNLNKELFAPSNRANYAKLKVEPNQIKETILSHPEFVAYTTLVKEIYTKWRSKNLPFCNNITEETKPKKFIQHISEDLLDAFSNVKLIDKYDVYQYIMNLWYEAMQDDVYVIVSDGWVNGNQVYRITKETKDKNDKVKVKVTEGIEGIESKLIKPILILNRYFTNETNEIKTLETKRDAITAQIEELAEEHSAEEALFADLDKVNKANVTKLLKEKKAEKAPKEEIEICQKYITLSDEEAKYNTNIKTLQKALEVLVWNKYQALTEDEIKTIVVQDKWMAYIENSIHSEMQQISQRLTSRIKELGERYAKTLKQHEIEVASAEAKVKQHLAKMGFESAL